MAHDSSIAVSGASGAVTWASADALLAQVTNRATTRLIKQMGFVLIEAPVRTLLTGDSSTTLRNVQIELGCLNNSFNMMATPSIDERLKSCENGYKALPTNMKYGVEGTITNISPELYAVMTGMTIIDPSATHPIRLIATETVTITSDVSSALTNDADTIFVVQTVGATNEYFHEVDSLTADDQFTYDSATKKLTFNTDYLADTTQVKVVYSYESTTATDGLVLKDLEGKGMPSRFSGILTFLAVDADNNTTGRVTVVFENAMNTAAINLGGAENQAYVEFPLSATIEGTPDVYWEEYAA